MALIGKGNFDGWYIGLSLMDNQGDITNIEYETVATSEAEAQVILDGIYAAFVLLSQSMIVGTTISKRLVESAPAYNAGADNSTKARTTVLLSGGTKKATFTIPAPVEGLFTAPSGPNNNVVDVTNTNLLDLMAWFGDQAPGNGALISDGETIDSPIAGRRVSVKKGMRP